MAKTRRLQVLIEDEQWARLEAAAVEQRVSVGAIVRGAIDRALPGTRVTRGDALRAILEAPPMDLPQPEELRRELDALRGGGAP